MKQQEDVAAVETLKGSAPVLGAAAIGQLEMEAATFLAECRRELRTAVRHGKKRSRSATVEVETEEASSSSVQMVAAVAMEHVEEAVLVGTQAGAGEPVRHVSWCVVTGVRWGVCQRWDGV